ncbi:MAG: hypothetical protein QXK42_04205 [Candidatus Korarchaeum sp.]
MSLLEELLKELDENPELAKELAKKLLSHLEPELSLLTIQMRRLIDQIATLVEEQAKLREDFNREVTRIWEEIRGIKEEQARTWRAIEELREDFNREVTRIWEEIRGIKEEQAKLREDFNREVTRIWEEIRGIKEEQARTWRAIEELQRSILGLDRKVDQMYEGLRSSMMYVFGEMRKFAGLTFEEFVRVFLTDMMRRSGEVPQDRELRSEEVEGEQIDLFLEEPLIVGETTMHAESDEEIDKLLRKAKIVAEKFGREPRKVLVVETAPKEIARVLRRRAQESGVELILGREL